MGVVTTLLIRKVRSTIEKYSMIESGSSVLVAVSGGPDSVALAHTLYELREPLDCRLQIAHLNHGLRGAESDADEKFVEALAGRLGLVVASERVDARALARAQKRSLEDACREARRAFLKQAARRLNCRVIATGHHSDDQAETVLLRLIRGTGVRGLAGIQPVTADGFIRPLIECSRRELRSYLEEKRIPFREDPSNLDRRYLRNRVRHELIPLLQAQFNPAIVDALCRVSRNMDDVQRLLAELASGALAKTLVETASDRMSLDLAALKSYDEVTWGYVFHSLYGILTGDSKGLSREHMRALVDLVGHMPTGASVQLPGGVRARKSYGTLQFFRHESDLKRPFFDKTVHVPGLTAVPEIGGVLETRIITRDDLPSDFKTVDPTEVFFDTRELSPPLKLRLREEGDRIQPFGFFGTKKLKDLFIELKIPAEARDRLPILADGKGLLWVAGVKRSDRAKILPATSEILRVRWRERG